MMNQLNTTQLFKNLQILYLALVVGQVLFGGIIWWLLGKMEPPVGGIFAGKSFLAFIILAWMVISATLFYRRRTVRGASLNALPLKLTHYRMSSIFRWGMIELGNMLVIVIAFLEQNQALMWLFVAGMAAFLWSKPSPEKFAADYQISEREKSEMGVV